MSRRRQRDDGSSSLETPTIASDTSSRSNHLQFPFISMVRGATTPILFKFIRRKKWKKVRRLLRTKRGTDLCKERDNDGFHALGVAISFGAPIDIVQLIVSIDALQVDAVDGFGSNPLHCACISGASLECVSFLLKQCKDLVSSTDKDRRTPLHLLMNTLCNCSDIYYAEGIQIIKAMCKLDTSIIHFADAHKNTPIDTLHLAWADTHPACERQARFCEMHTILREISIQEYKKKKMTWEEKSHFDETKSISNTNSTSCSSRKKDGKKKKTIVSFAAELEEVSAKKPHPMT